MEKLGEVVVTEENNGTAENAAAEEIPVAAENRAIVVTEPPVEMPAIEMPAVEKAALEMPAMETPDLEMPALETPPVEMPPPPLPPADVIAYTVPSSFIAQAKAEYAEVHRRIIEKIRPHHLEPIVKILSEREKITTESAAGLVESLKAGLGKRLNSEEVLNQPGVANNLITLEMLKKKFQQYEGVNWDVQNKTPEQRTLPLQMQFKEKQMNALRRQMSFQKVELDKVLAENKERRSRIQEITQERIYLQQNMVRHAQLLKQMDEEMLDMQSDLFDLIDA